MLTYAEIERTKVQDFHSSHVFYEQNRQMPYNANNEVCASFYLTLEKMILRCDLLVIIIIIVCVCVMCGETGLTHSNIIA